jgi:hypothetical protein
MKIIGDAAVSRGPCWRASGTWLTAVAIAATLGACVQLGPTVLSSGRPLYNYAVQQTESEQLLLNIVRNRYNDPVLFLDVTSISSGFNWQATAGFLANSKPSVSDKATFGGTLGATVGETPFITYAPNTGEKFVRQMLTPVDLRTVTLIVQSGWSIERVLLIIGESINQLRNRPLGENLQSGYLQFQQVAAALRELQRSGLVSLGAEPEKDEPEGKNSKADKKAKADKDDGDDNLADLALMIDPDAVKSEAYRTVCQSIKVACDGRPLSLRQAIGVSSNSETLSLATRSLFSALYFLAQGVEVPATDLEVGTASPLTNLAGGPFDENKSRGKLFHVYSAASEPDLAAVKVFYRNSWFYIADNDTDTKVTFALVSMLVMLQSGGTSQMAPLITLPIN